MKLSLHLPLLCAAALSTPCVHSQSGPNAPSGPLLETVTVTGNPLAATDLVVPTSSLSGKDLLLRRKASLGQTLDGEPGVSSTYFGPIASRPTIRGQDGDRIRILNNGGASLDASGLSFDHAVAIDPMAIERIEVLRGPGALQYGGNAVGGVVNVINNRIQESPQFDRAGGASGRAELRAGGAERERAASAVVETGNDKYSLHVDAFGRASADLRVPIALPCDRSGTGQSQLTKAVCNSSGSARGGALGGTLYFDQGYLGASVETHHSRYGSVAEDTVTLDMQQTRYALQAALLRLPGPFQSIKAQWSAVNYQHTELESGLAGTQFANRGQDFRLEARQLTQQVAGGKVDGMVGLHAEGNQFSANGIETFSPFTRNASQALFTYEEWVTPSGKLSAGARVEQVQVSSMGHPTLSRFQAGSRNFTPTNFALGGLLNLGSVGSGWAATANLSVAQRAPKDYELYANGPHLATAAYEVGSAALGLERSTNLDWGLNWKGGPHAFGLSAFVNRFNNYIALESTGRQRDAQGNAVALPICADGHSAESGCSSAVLPEYAYRQSQARFYGLESNGKVRLMGRQGWLPGKDTVDLTLKADLVRAVNLDAGQPLPRIAPARLGALLAWSENAGGQGWGARLGLDHYAAQNRIPNGDRATSGYRFWNLSATYGVNAGAQQWLWFARLENAANQLAYSASSILTQSAPGRVPMPGRSFKLGLQATF